MFCDCTRSLAVTVKLGEVETRSKGYCPNGIFSVLDGELFNFWVIILNCKYNVWVGRATESNLLFSCSLNVIFCKQCAVWRSVKDQVYYELLICLEECLTWASVRYACDVTIVWNTSTGIRPRPNARGRAERPGRAALAVERRACRDSGRRGRSRPHLAGGPLSGPSG
jgi:hypothetical protein